MNALDFSPLFRSTIGFDRLMQLADFIQVKSAGLENGLLNVELERVVPEALKPRKIEIGVANGAKPIEQKAA